MKRTYERLLFMVAGAFIAFCAYMIGNIDNDINAEEVADIRRCESLIVNRTIVVGDPKGKYIGLTVDQNSSAILLGDTTIGGHYTVHARDGKILNKLTYGDVDNPDSIVRIVVDKDGAYISAQSKKGLTAFNIGYNNDTNGFF